MLGCRVRACCRAQRLLVRPVAAVSAFDVAVFIRPEPLTSAHDLSRTDDLADYYREARC